MDTRFVGWANHYQGLPYRPMERRTILSISRPIAASDRSAVPGLRSAQRSTSRSCSSMSFDVSHRHHPS